MERREKGRGRVRDGVREKEGCREGGERWIKKGKTKRE